MEKYIKLRKEYINQQFEHLNEMQRQAVFKIKGAVLILAGAGSGKTSVLINRISNMVRFGDSYNVEYFPFDCPEAVLNSLEKAVENKTKLSFSQEEMISANRIRPYNILAITFTNKAAGELKQRLETSLGEYSYDVMASTFHSLCVRILRKYATTLGYNQNFTIYDSDDQKRIVREIMKDLNIDDKFIQIKTVISRMSGYKDKLISPQKAEEYASNIHEKQIVACYNEYQKRLKSASAFDFDDLIYKTVELFSKNEEALLFYQNRYKYIMVDEYQDTSTAQFELVRLLSMGHNNICVVGDDDQSIYRFRGATIENILNFENQFQDTFTIKLEENYRSTSNILNAANSVIQNNKGRKGKTLWTQKEDGEKVCIYNFEREFDESANVVSQIFENIKNGAKLSDHAVLYRMNMQSSLVENALARNGLAYKVIGGQRFYDRAEIKDLTAYMNIIVNPSDDLRLKRIINTPTRKIGATTIQKIQDIATEKGISMIEVLYNMYEYPSLSKSLNALNNFLMIYKSLQELYKTRPLEDFIPNLIKITGYENMLIEMGEDGKTRLENIGQLDSNIKAYVDQYKEEATLASFLEEVSLISDLDRLDRDADAVTLMTIHSSKGLEFPYVFLVGVEEGIFPGEQSKYNNDDLEEERRLFYVAVTRAEKEIYISHCNERMVFGQTKRPLRSRFLEEVDKDVCEEIDRNPNRTTVNLFSKPSVSAKTQSFNNQSTIKGAGEKPPVKINKDFDIGDRVLHKAFGEGTVLKITPLANDAMLEIDFGSKGKKKIMVNYTPITKIEG